MDRAQVVGFYRPTAKLSNNCLIAAFALVAMLIVKSAFATTVPYAAWSAPVGTPTSSSGFYGSYVAVAPNGNVYIDGVTTGAVYGVSNNNENSFVAEYSPSGNLLWDQVTSGTQFNGIAVDASNNVYVGSNAAGTGAVLKYNSSGTLQWSTNVGNGVNGIAVSPAGNVFVSAGTDGSNGTNALVANVSATGQLLWTRAPDPSSPASATFAVAVNSAGDVFATGVNESNSYTVSNSFIVEYDSAGNLLWNPQLGAAGSNTQTSGILVDAAGNVYVSGFGPSLFGESTQGGSDFVVGYNSANAEQWVDRFEMPLGLMKLHAGPNGTAMVDATGDFLGFGPGGNATSTIPWDTSNPDDFAYNNGNIYFATYAFEPPTDGLGGFLTDIVVPEPSTFVLLAIGGAFCAIACARRRNRQPA
jgi:hypothetical protein